MSDSPHPDTNETSVAPGEIVAADSATDRQPGDPQERHDEDLEHNIVLALQTVFDPEIPVNIYELGLIYSIEPSPEGQVEVKMTLTSPNCPVAESLPGEVRAKVETVAGVSAARVEVVWDPPWTPDMMSEAAKLELGMF